MPGNPRGSAWDVSSDDPTLCLPRSWILPVEREEGAQGFSSGRADEDHLAEAGKASAVERVPAHETGGLCTVRADRGERRPEAHEAYGFAGATLAAAPQAQGSPAGYTRVTLRATEPRLVHGFHEGYDR